MGGGNQSSKQNTEQTNNIAPELRPLYEQTAGYITDLQPGIASQFGDFFSANPQQIPGMTEQQNDIFRRYQAAAQGPSLNDPQNQALSQLNYLTSGELGQSPATQAAMKAVRDPALNDLAMAGLGNSDAVGSNLAAAYSPILAAEMQNRSAAVGQYGALGQAQFGQGIQNMTNYNQMAEQQRGLAESQGAANFQDFLRRQGLGTQFTTGILSGFPALSGTSQVVKSSGSGGGK